MCFFFLVGAMEVAHVILFNLHLQIGWLPNNKKQKLSEELSDLQEIIVLDLTKDNPVLQMVTNVIFHCFGVEAAQVSQPPTSGGLGTLSPPTFPVSRFLPITPLLLARVARSCGAIRASVIIFPSLLSSLIFLPFRVWFY
jgi:hypothetical protein